MSGKFAKGTSVPSSRSRAEIEQELMRYGAIGFGYAMESKRAAVQFQIGNRRVRMLLPLPDIKDPLFEPARLRWNKTRESARQEKWEQACRSVWRSLLLVIKAKLEAVACGISTVEREFMADIMLPNGKTVGEVMKPQIEVSYSTGKMPPLLGLSE